MTIVIALKVNDGVALAADSATSFPVVDAAGNVTISRVYNNASKVFCLHKDLPLGAATWGLASVASKTIALLMKDVRARLTGDDPIYETWKLAKRSYSVRDVADKVYKYVYEQNYVPTYENNPGAFPELGLAIAGYSAGQDRAEVYSIDVDRAGNSAGPRLLSGSDQPGTMIFHGQPEALNRLIWGFDYRLAQVLQADLGVDPTDIPGTIQVLREKLQTYLWSDEMPIQDAIDLVEFLAYVSANYSRFTAGAVTIGGPIELAAITKYEHFKWVRRKHYYRRKFNPGGAT